MIKKRVIGNFLNRGIKEQLDASAQKMKVLKLVQR
jgi:hypothetical protein